MVQDSDSSMSEHVLEAVPEWGIELNHMILDLHGKINDLEQAATRVAMAHDKIYREFKERMTYLENFANDADNKAIEALERVAKLEASVARIDRLFGAWLDSEPVAEPEPYPMEDD